MTTSELTEMDAKILQYVEGHEPASVADVERALPDISAISYRMQDMATPATINSVPISNSSYLLQDYRDIGFGRQEALGTYRVTDFGRKALQDYLYTKHTYKRELWLKNAWIPIIVAFVTTALTNYILPKLPLLIELCRRILSRISS